MPWTYPAIMLAAIVTGLLLFRFAQKPPEMTGREKLAVFLGGFCGGMIGARLPFLLADWQGLLDGSAWLANGKTIVSGLVGGYLGVQIAEWAMGIRQRMCDSFAVPLAGAMAVGRLACFSGGCCYGKVTSLPWGVDFGDGLLRHPTQIYESLFHLLAAVVLFQFQRRELFRGQLIKLYFVSYFAYRFLTEFIRPEPPLWLGLTGYQYAVLVLAVFFTVWCCRGCQPSGARGLARWMLPFFSEGSAPPPKDSGHFVKETRALCPACLTSVPGETYEQEGRVYLRRNCPKHGETTSLVSSNRQHYYLRDEVIHPPPGQTSGCSTSPGHKTCVALLEITGACNLTCPVCFADSSKGRHRSFEELCADLERFLRTRAPLEVLQLSGGEPLLHPDLLRIVDHVKTLPIEAIMINTNGLEFLRRPELASELARRTPGLELYLQFDGLKPENYKTLRGADLLEKKLAVLRRTAECGLPTTLVCTVARRVNEDQLGPLLRLGLSVPTLRGICFQAATWTGRFQSQTDPLDRITLADVVRLACEQADGLLAPDDFKPLPCSHPNCCSFTVISRRHGKPLVPLTRTVRLEDHVNRLADRVNFNLDDARRCCSPAADPADFFRVFIKPFMDAHTFDAERAEECCIHVIRPGGEAVSFCRFNVLQRHVPSAAVPLKSDIPIHEVVDAQE